MAKHVDHIVWAVQDLALAKTSWEALGFQVTPMGVHPFGTANRLVMSDQFFVELLTVHDPEKVIPSTEAQASFSGLNQMFLQEDEGVSMIVLSSDNAQEDVDNYLALGLKASPITHFSRAVVLPNGEEAKLAFSIAFVLHPEMPQLNFFVCQHHYPEHFWKKAYQVHPNHFLRLKSLEVVLDKAEDFVMFFHKVLGTPPMQLENDLYRFETSAEEIYLMTAAKFLERNALENERVKAGVNLVSFQLNSSEALESHIEKAKLEIHRKTEQSILLRDQTTKIWLQFEW